MENQEERLAKVIKRMKEEDEKIIKVSLIMAWFFFALLVIFIIPREFLSTEIGITLLLIFLFGSLIFVFNVYKKLISYLS